MGQMVRGFLLMIIGYSTSISTIYFAIEGVINNNSSHVLFAIWCLIIFLFMSYAEIKKMTEPREKP